MAHEQIYELENGRWQGYDCTRCGIKRTYSTRKIAKKSINTMCTDCHHQSQKAHEQVYELENGRWQGYGCPRCGKNRTYVTRQHARNSINWMCLDCWRQSDEIKEQNKKGGRSRIVDITGMRFGKLLVLNYHELRKGNRGEARWECICDCGKKCVRSGANLRRKEGVRSCGCLQAHPPIGYGEGALHATQFQYQRNAKLRKMDWEIDESQFAFLIVQPCIYCGASNENCKKTNYNGMFYYTGIDRVHNNVGYIPGNIVPCCNKCNMAKKKLSIKEWAQLISRASGHPDEYESLYSKWAKMVVFYARILQTVREEYE